jgi:type III secretion system low calcium response chaperone LcrH/SycD
MYNSGKYQGAGQLFRLLVMLNATEPKYMLGLAGCYHLEKEYENAILVYALVQVLAPNDPAPCYHSADCYLQMHAPKFAREQLEKAHALCGDKREYHVLKDRIEAALTGLGPEVTQKKAPEVAKVKK